MPGTKTFIANFLITAASLSFGATADYFPVQTGNAWVFKNTSRWFNGPAETLEIEATERFRDRDYARVSFAGRTVYLRSTGNGLVAFNPTSGTESTWIDFEAPEGQSFPIEIEQCTRAAKIVSRAAKVTTPAGEWTNALHFTFEQSCADAGITQMFFVPGVGPVKYETTSIAGPISHELIYTRAGSHAAEAAQTAFTVGLDRTTYPAGETVNLQVRLTLRSSEPITLTFPSTQRYDLRVWNDQGQIVYTWSADKLFAQVVTNERVGPGERNFVFATSVPNLPPGRYVAESWLATQSREYVGTIGFFVVR